MTVPMYALKRTFFIKADAWGSAFVALIDGRQFLVTAKHLFAPDRTEWHVDIHEDGAMKTYPLELVGGQG